MRMSDFALQMFAGVGVIGSAAACLWLGFYFYYVVLWYERGYDWRECFRKARKELY